MPLASTLDATVATAPAEERAAGPVAPVSFAGALQWAAVIGVGLSTQYLVQPFVWRQWPPGEVLLGWLDVARDRILVAAWIAVAIAAASWLRAMSGPLRTAIVGVAIVVGGLLGEATLVTMDASLGTPSAPSARRVLESILIALCACGIWSLWRRADALEARARGAALAESRAEAALAEARLLALRQQIEPHFLFNTLATVARFHETGSLQAARLLAHLERYVESSLPTHAMTTSLGEELALVESYLSIVEVRMSGRLTWRIEAGPELRACECPSLAVGTLVENAVKHGLMAIPGAASIEITARKAGPMIEVTVADTGAGMLGHHAPAGGSGLGLSNTRARLFALYGAGARLELQANAPRGVRAVMRWPMAAR